MRVVVVGATGNVGTSLVRVLSEDSRIQSVLGVARRRPGLELPKVEWATADVVQDDLAGLFSGANAVVHLAWAIQPSRDEAALRHANIGGSARVAAATIEAGVPALVYASSVGTYSPGPQDRLVDESWPTDGISSSFYSRHKAAVERHLDVVERGHPGLRIVRLRPALTFRRSAAEGIRRLFLGPFLPPFVFRRGLIPLAPWLDDLRFQAVHSDDVADAYRRAVVSDVRGAFNVAAEPVVDRGTMSRLLGARIVALPRWLGHPALSALWRLRLQPSPPGWIDMGLSVPMLDTTRAREELDWSPRHTAVEAVTELLEGLSETAGDATPPLARSTSGRARVREVATGVGARDGVARTEERSST
ncbi:MAG TPA: NAD-dependent epimerase/dehydratase family protein [Gaiella sp.]|nr:NAD-dependent epimerase/dehydratase family protein [Gaiella sp.]